MRTIIHLPVSAQDEPVFNEIATVCCELMRDAAGLGKDFNPFQRQRADFVAKGLGRTSAGHLFATAPQTLSPIDGPFARKDVMDLLLKALSLGMEKLPPGDLQKLSSEQLVAIAHALPAIVQAAAEQLKQLDVDRFTFERTVLDPLLAKHVPPYEFGIFRDRSKVFVFEDAREKLRNMAAAEGVDVVRSADADAVLGIIRASFYPLTEVVTRMGLPLTHKPIVLTDQEGMVVGVTFQHPLHEGVVPVCCESLERYAAVQAALLLPGQAQTSPIPSDFIGLENPNKIFPFRTGFMRDRRPDGPPVFYAQVSPEKAIAYLGELEAAFNGARVACTEDDLKQLRGATLGWVDVSSPASGKTRRRWGLISVPNDDGPTFIMSATGVVGQGIESHAQWYLRQSLWLDEAAVPELALMPTYAAPARPYDNEVTKIIPTQVKSFWRNAKAHVDGMPESKKSSAPVRAATARVKKQDALLWEIEAALEKEAAARAEARRASLMNQGFAGAVCRVPIDV